MPIYMDRHDVSEIVTAENVAQLHQADLKVQDKFGCKGLTYWFDDKRKTAFCLVEAPDAASVQKMHNHAHGEVPHRIIEVDPAIVESFLGRIEDPEKAQNTHLNIINDPAFRTIMVVELKRQSFKPKDLADYNVSLSAYNELIHKSVDRFKGRIAKQTTGSYVVSFNSVSQAILCALDIQQSKHVNKYVKLQIGMSAGAPVTKEETIFAETIRSARYLSYIANTNIIISAEVGHLYESENLNASIDTKLARVLTLPEENFLNLLMDHLEKLWQDSTLKVEDFSKSLAYSKSQLYRSMMELIGKSPNAFIKEYRLDRALRLLDQKSGNVSEIAFQSGFNSPSYFSKCFLKNYGITPSEYLESN